MYLFRNFLVCQTYIVVCTGPNKILIKRETKLLVFYLKGRDGQTQEIVIRPVTIVTFLKNSLLPYDVGR